MKKKNWLAKSVKLGGIQSVN